MDFGYRDVKEQWFDMADEHYGKKVDDVAVKDLIFWCFDIVLLMIFIFMLLKVLFYIGVCSLFPILLCLFLPLLQKKNFTVTVLYYTKRSH